MKNKWLKSGVFIAAFALVVVASRFVFYYHRPIANSPFLSYKQIASWRDQYDQPIDSLIRLHEKNVFVYLSDSSVVDQELGEKLASFAHDAEQSGWGVHGFSIYDYNQTENLRHEYQWAFPFYSIPVQAWSNQEKKGVHISASIQLETGELFDLSNCADFDAWVKDIQ